MDDIRKIAFFPLNVCLLPGDDIPLKIFEPRYKQLIQDCENGLNSFGIPYLHQKKIQVYGSEVKLKQIVARNSLGEMVIVVEGVSNFEMVRYNEKYLDRMYSGGIISKIETDHQIQSSDLLLLIDKFSERLDPEFFNINDDSCKTSNNIARTLNLSSHEKFIFLDLPDYSAREKFLIKQVQYLYKLREQEKLLKDDFFLN